MKPINKILFLTDFSDTAANAFTYTLLMAESLNADVELLHCVYPGTAFVEMPAYNGDVMLQIMEVREKNMVEFVERGITSIVQQVHRLPSITQKVELGGAVSTAHQMAEEDDFDLVVMGTQGAHTTWGNIFGTTSSGMLMNAPCPVLIVPQKATFKKFEKICFAADMDGVEVLSGEELIASFHPMTPDLHFFHVNLKEVEEQPLDFELIGMLYNRKNLPFKVTVSEVTSTDVADAIITESESMQVDLIVMSRPHYNLFDQLLHKSITRDVALHTFMPLLVINEKPQEKLKL